MTVVTIHEAKTNLSKLLKLVEAGEEVVIARGSVHVARILPMKPVQKKSRGYGAWKGQVGEVPDFLEPISKEELALWEDGPIEPTP
jgi:prevent-host-death family protein